MGPRQPLGDLSKFFLALGLCPPWDEGARLLMGDGLLCHCQPQARHLSCPGVLGRACWALGWEGPVTSSGVFIYRPVFPGRGLLPSPHPIPP